MGSCKDSRGLFMKILVPIKRVIDFAVHIKIKPDETGIETSNVKMSMNPFDEIALEEAVRLKEKGIATEIIVISIGTLQCQETLRTALAMGADRAILIESPADIEPLLVAKIIKQIALKETPQFIILGKQAIDTDNNQVGQMLAGLLSWSQGTFVSNVSVEGENVIVTREVDGGLEKIKLRLPSVLTTDLRLNQPRYLSLPNIVQAKRKPLDIINISEFQLDLKPRVMTLKVTPPERRPSGKIVADVKELVAKLKYEAQVI